MRNAPSGPVNANVSTLLNNITVAGNGSSQSVNLAIPTARIGDTAYCSFDSGAIGPMAVGSVVIPANGQVIVNLFNYTPNPFTINNVNMYIEVVPRG